MLVAPPGGPTGNVAKNLEKEHLGLLWQLSGKKSACNAGDSGSIPGLGRSPGEGNGNPLSWTEDPGGLIVPEVAKSWT